MWRGLGTAVALALAVILFETPYGAWVFYRLLGTSTVSYVSGTGLPSWMELGPGAARPEWAALSPDALFITGARSGPDGPRLETGSFDYVSWSDPDRLRAFYRERLEPLGFEVVDDGIGPLNPAGARLLGIAGMMRARDSSNGRELRIAIRTGSGFVLPGRYVQIVWAKTAPGEVSAWPDTHPTPSSPPIAGQSKPS
jgi:hypothetical protein